MHNGFRKTNQSEVFEAGKNTIPWRYYFGKGVEAMRLRSCGYVTERLRRLTSFARG